MTRADIARQVAHQLIAAENALDVAIRDYARLTAELMEARPRAHVSPTVGGEAVARAAAVQTALAGARAESAALHAALAEVRDGLGVRMDDDGFGAGDKTNVARPAWPPLAAAGAEPLRAAG